MKFGAFVRDKRLKANLSLREFCNRAQIDPSNWSKIERDRLSLTYDREKLEEIAGIIQIKKNSTDWTTFFDLAMIAKKQIPNEIYSDEEILNALPIFFRSALGQPPTEEELNRVIEILKRR